MGLDASLASASRTAAGDLPVNGFARPSAAGGMVDSGVDLGLPFVGAAPDIGAVELDAAEVLHESERVSADR